MAEVESKQAAKRLGGFELLKKIGRGGMGIVYRARQVSMNRIVAIKVLSPRLSHDKEYTKRFVSEAQAVAKLNHRNIVQGIDAGEANGLYYFAMEYVDGETVHQMILREGVLNEKLSLSIVRDIAHALSHAQRVALVHRDIKPGNIMLTRGGVTKLCDLGLARVGNARTAPAGKRQVAVGTPYYISPEQAMGQDNVDIRSDIYSLGATFYRMVVGEVAFDGETPGEILTKHVEAPLPWPSSVNPNVSDYTSQLIAKMMAKKPEERYQSPAELVPDVERVLNDQPPLSTEVQFEIPPAKAGRTAGRGADERISRKKAALREVYEVKLMAKEAAKEQNVPLSELATCLRGNLDEGGPQTFVKYGLLALTEGNFEVARDYFKKAHEGKAPVGKYLQRLEVLATPRGMACVPAGEARIGPPGAEKVVACGAYYIDLQPVTNEDYARFVKANDYPPPKYWRGKAPPARKEDHPVVGVSWDDARSYAVWAGRQLPTSVQWERAARGGDDRSYPWGGEFDPALCNTRESGPADTTPAGSYRGGLSPYGCADMAGNVWEWLRDTAEAESGEDTRLTAGGSWKDAKEAAVCYHRRAVERTRRDGETGFRCVKLA